MKKLNIKMGIILALLLSFFGMSLINVSAETYNQLSIKAIIPENQIDKNRSYFDLMMAPNQKQDIQLSITNNGEESMVAEISLNDASTGNNGVIIYTEEGKKDQSLKLAATQIVKIANDKVEIEPKKNVLVNLSINMPENKFGGNVLSGIIVKGKKLNPEKTEEKEKSITINNEIVYVVGLNLRMDKDSVKPHLNLISVKDALVNYRTGVVANIQNDQAVIMKGVKINGEIKKKGSDDVVSKVDLKSADIAPNTNFDVVYDWNGKAIKKGKYQIRMTAEYEGEKWVWDEEFEIKDPSEVNTGAYFMESTNNHWLLITLSIIGAILIFLLILVLKRRKKDDMKEGY